MITYWKYTWSEDDIFITARNHITKKEKMVYDSSEDITGSVWHTWINDSIKKEREGLSCATITRIKREDVEGFLFLDSLANL